MKYVADVLTFLRFVFALIVLIALLQGAWAAGQVFFILGILSDALDGVAARKWPYPKDEPPHWWRKDPHVFDNVADVTLSGAGLVGITFKLLPFWGAVAVVAAVGLLSACIAATVAIVGKTNAKRAEQIDVVHGWIFGSELTAMLVIITIQASEAWIYFLIAYAVVGVPLIWLKRDRLMSRDELTYG